MSPTPLKKNVRISVVIPLFNKEALIGNTLQSVLDQSFTGYEVIVVDDGSTDASAGIVETFTKQDPRIQLIRQANAHVSAARNRGIQAAKGSYVAFLDADDLWLPNHLEEIAALIDQCPEAGMLGTAYWRRLEGRPDSGAIVKALEGRRGIVENYFAIAIEYQFIYTSSIAIRKDALDQVGGFDEADKLFSEDLALWTKVAARFPVAYSSEFTVIYLCDVPGQATSGGRAQRGLSPQLPLAFKEILESDEKLLVPKQSIRIYCETIIRRRLFVLLMAKPPAMEHFKTYAEGGKIDHWVRTFGLRALVKYPWPWLWKPYHLLWRLKIRIRSVRVPGARKNGQTVVFLAKS